MATQSRAWSLPPEHCVVMQVSAYGDGLPTAMRQANLKKMEVRGGCISSTGEGRLYITIGGEGHSLKSLEARGGLRVNRESISLERGAVSHTGIIHWGRRAAYHPLGWQGAQRRAQKAGRKSSMGASSCALLRDQLPVCGMHLPHPPPLPLIRRRAWGGRSCGARWSCCSGWYTRT